MSAIQGEMAVLGCLILHGDLIDDVLGELKPRDFSDYFHKELYECLIDMRHAKKPIDMITVSEHFDSIHKDQNSFVDVANLANYPCTPHNIKGYVEIVKKESNRRKTQALMTETLSRLRNNDETYLEFLKRGILNMENEATSLMPTYGELLARSVQEIEEHAAAGGGIIGLSTGFTDIDNLARGLRPGHLIVVGARPSMGKTIFMMNMADNLAMVDKSVAVFSLEMSDTEICKRTLARAGRLNGTRVVEGDLNGDEWRRLGEIAESLKDKKLSLVYKSGLSSFEVRTTCRRIKNQFGLDAVFIDYLGKMGGYDDIKMETHRLGKITGDLKALAIDFKVPVILLCQLNRNVSARENKLPTLADLRDSGSIEQDADLVMFLDQEKIWKPDTHRQNEADIIIAKNRHGAIGKVILTTCLEFFEFRNYINGNGSQDTSNTQSKARYYGKRYSEKERD